MGVAYREKFSPTRGNPTFAAAAYVWISSFRASYCLAQEELKFTV
jgi:hypothetical protein